jgi:hypothetical protein
MKLVLSFIISMLITGVLSAQLKSSSSCGTVLVDIYKGWINKALPQDHPEQIKAKMPCYTRYEQEGNESPCGGGVYYTNRDIRFMIQRDYIVIGENCKDAFNLVLLGKKEEDFFSELGSPKMKDANWKAYQMSYGTLILFFNQQGLVNKIIITNHTTDDVNLCNEMSE